MYRAYMARAQGTDVGTSDGRAYLPGWLDSVLAFGAAPIASTRGELVAYATSHFA